jgi:hypothetical protein
MVCNLYQNFISLYSKAMCIRIEIAVSYHECGYVFFEIKKKMLGLAKCQGDIVIIWSLPKFLVSLRLQKGPELWPLGKEFYSLALGLASTCFGL